MTVEQLATILAYADIEPKREVQVRVQKEKEGTLTSVEIKSFNVYSDAIVLQVEVGKDF